MKKYAIKLIGGFCGYGRCGRRVDSIIGCISLADKEALTETGKEDWIDAEILEREIGDTRKKNCLKNDKRNKKFVQKNKKRY